MAAAVREEAHIEAGAAMLRADFDVSEHATGLVPFAHGSGSSRFSRRNRAVARVLEDGGLANAAARSSDEKALTFPKGRGGASTALRIDAEGAMGNAYGAVVTPHLFIVGADGTVVYAGGTGNKPTMDAKEVRSSSNFIREALNDLAAGGKVTTATSAPFGCTIAYRG
jgi:hypothetical protein